MTRQHTQHTIAIRVRGLFDSSYPDASKGILFGYGPKPDTLPSGYAWEESLVDIPVSAEQRLDLPEWDWSDTRYTFNIHANAPLMQIFQRRAGLSNIELLGTLTQDDTDQLVHLSTTRNMEGEIVYLRDETIKLGSHNGLGSSSRYSGSTRGYAGSPVQRHPVNGSPPVQEIIPHWNFRTVDVFIVDRETGDLDTRWVGYLTNEPSTTNSTTIIKLDATAFEERLRHIELNRDPAERTIAQGTYQHEPLRPWGDLEQNTQSVAKEVEGEVRSNAVAIQVDDRIIGTRNGSFGSTDFSEAQFGGNFLDKEAWSTIEETEGWEVLVISPEMDENLIFPLADPDDLSPTQNLPYPYHPVSIFMAHACSTASDEEDVSTFDVLHPNWGAGLKFMFEGNFDEINNLIEATSDITVDHYIRGFDGDSFSLMDTAKELLQLWGFQMGFKQDGTMTIWKAGSLSISDMSTEVTDSHIVGKDSVDVALEQGHFDFTTSPFGSLDSIKVEFGKVPGDVREPNVFETVDATRSRRAYWLADARKRELKANYISADRSDFIESYLLNEESRRRFGSALIKCKAVSDLAVDADKTFDIGRPVTLDLSKWEDSEAFMIAPDGTRLSVSDFPSGLATHRTRNDNTRTDSFVGYITGYRHLLESNTYELTILLPQYRVGQLTYMRAPALSVSSANGGDSFFKAETTQPDYGFPTDVLNGFYETYPLNFYTRDGKKLDGGPYTIDSIASPQVNLKESLLTDYPEGTVARLSGIQDLEQQPDPALGSGILVPFAYIAGDEDSNGEDYYFAWDDEIITWLWG